MLESNKTKIAKRVIEVFEYFDENHRTATVMDIVRRFGRPQSSTSELLGSLVEMGLLYKDPCSRSYWPTPRLAAMGASAQPSAIHAGCLFAFMDDLARSTRLSLALFGMVGTHVQIFHWAPAPGLPALNVHRGGSVQLSASAAGQLLLSTIEHNQAGRLLRRLNAEAPQDAKFNVADLDRTMTDYGRDGHATGQSGFIVGSLVMALLLPVQSECRPLALGFVYPEGAAIDTRALLATLERGVAASNPDSNDEALAPPLIRAV